MDAATIATIKASINTTANIAKATAGVLDPALIPAIVVGQAILDTTPDLVNDVQQWLAKKDPTPADDDAIAQKIARLSDPDSL